MHALNDTAFSSEAVFADVDMSMPFRSQNGLCLHGAAARVRPPSDTNCFAFPFPFPFPSVADPHHPRRWRWKESSPEVQRLSSPRTGAGEFRASAQHRAWKLINLLARRDTPICFPVSHHHLFRQPRRDSSSISHLFVCSWPSASSRCRRCRISAIPRTGEHRAFLTARALTSTSTTQTRSADIR